MIRALLGQDGGRFHVADTAGVALDLTRQARRELCVLSVSLEPDLFDGEEFATAVSALARRHRHTRVRLLVADSRPLRQSRHRLLHLARRLESSISLRCCHPDQADVTECWLLADQRGLLVYTPAQGRDSWADYNNRPLAQDRQEHFERLWAESREDPDLRQLSL